MQDYFKISGAMSEFEYAYDTHGFYMRSPRRRPTLSARPFALVTAIVAELAAPNVVLAEPLDYVQKAIDVITTTADKICNDVSTKGKATISEAKGDVKAQLSGLASKLADVGVSAAGKLTSDEYQNVLQKDLPSSLKDNAACKLKVLEDLKDIFFPEVLVPPPTPRPRR